MQKITKNTVSTIVSALAVFVLVAIPMSAIAADYSTYGDYGTADYDYGDYGTADYDYDYSDYSGGSSYSSEGPGSGYNPPVKNPAPTCKVKATPSSVEYGSDVTITWTTTNADTVKLSGFGEVPKNNKNYNHSRTDKNITQDKTYTLTVKGNGKTVTCKDSVKVKAQPKPAPECTLVASPSHVEYDGSTTLTWTTKNADQVMLGNSEVSTDGSKTFSNLKKDKTYSLTVKGNGKTIICKDTVSVKNKPTTPSTDICPNIPGIQTSLPYNHKYENGKCVPIEIVINNENNNQNVNNNNVTVNVNGYTEDRPYHNPSCNLAVSRNYITPGQATVLSWYSYDADYGYINNGIGSVDDRGSRTVYPHYTTTYTGTFYGDHNEQVHCSVTVNVQNYPSYYPPQTPYVTLSAVPYTGLELGPVGTAIYWSFLVLWCLVAAYLIAVKKVHYTIARRIKSFLFGSQESHVASAQTVDMATLAAMVTAIVNGSQKTHTPVLHTAGSHAHAVHTDATDEFILSQIHRGSHGGGHGH